LAQTYTCTSVGFAQETGGLQDFYGFQQNSLAQTTPVSNINTFMIAIFKLALAVMAGWVLLAL